MTEAQFHSTADLMGPWRDDLLSGEPPTRYPVGSNGFDRIEIGPGLVSLIGGAPGQGKTALVMQWVLEALNLTPRLKALICNVEMPPTVLLERQLARLAGVDLTSIRRRRISSLDAEAIDRGLQALEHLGERLAFIRPPYDLENVARSADAFEADLIVLDYIQRIRAHGEHGDQRGAVSETMDYLRQFADRGIAIIVVAALSRSKDSKGRSSYTDGLSLASFRETSELEYGADDAFILVPGNGADADGKPSSRVVLRHLKSRHGETGDMHLDFDRKHQRFMPSTIAGTRPKESNITRSPANRKLHADLQQLWSAAKAEKTEEADAL